MAPFGTAKRDFLTVYRRGDANGSNVAELLRLAATDLAALGPVIVRHVGLDASEDLRASEVCLTVYYDETP